jgi:hypothetical protein
MFDTFLAPETAVFIVLNTPDTAESLLFCGDASKFGLCFNDPETAPIVSTSTALSVSPPKVVTFLTGGTSCSIVLPVAVSLVVYFWLAITKLSFSSMLSLLKINALWLDITSLKRLFNSIFSCLDSLRAGSVRSSTCLVLPPTTSPNPCILVLLD